MRHEIAFVVLVLSAFIAQSHTVAAAPGQHTGRQAGHARPGPAPDPPPTAPQVNPPAAGEAPFQSTLKFEPKQRVEQQRAVPLPLDRLGRPLLFASPFLVDGVVAHGLMGNGQLAYPLPSSAPAGGVQLDVQPWRAEVYVDGTHVGAVRDFTGYYHHLEVSAGPHVIAIVAPDYEPLVLDLFVSPGRVTTYHGTLSAASGR